MLEAPDTLSADQIFNIYCDESCHLENDGQMTMVLGAIWCPAQETRTAAEHIREIKKSYRLSPRFEIKWTKVSPARADFYLDLIDYFFNNKNLHFRALIVPDKSKLRHSDFGQDHDTWYYKMYFEMLKVILTPGVRNRIYLDIKDTQSAPKMSKLHEVLSNNIYAFAHETVKDVQTVRSHEVELLQLADLLIGTVSYANRGLSGSSAKQELVNRVKQLSKHSLIRPTFLKEEKMNLFKWVASEA
ncbi:MAG: DUF3800 domain-containing protein [Rubrobacteraceae bacterium]